MQHPLDFTPPPPHDDGLIIDHACARLGINNAELARRLGVTKQLVSLVRLGRQGLSCRLADRIDDILAAAAGKDAAR